MSIKKQTGLVSAIVLLALVVDQISKIYIKTHFELGEAREVFSWFWIVFVENNGMAFGIEWFSKLLLTLFRIVAVGVIGWYIHIMIHNQQVRLGYLITIAMVIAGALGNIIDCFVYGLIWPETVMSGAPFAFLFGQVVDMFYFPLFDYKLPWMEYPRTFFGAVFNFADSCVTCGAIYLLLFQYKFFAQEEEKMKK